MLYLAPYTSIDGGFRDISILLEYGRAAEDPREAQVTNCMETVPQNYIREIEHTSLKSS